MEDDWTLADLAQWVDEYAQGPGEGDPRVQLAAVMLQDAIADDPRVLDEAAATLLSIYVQLQEAAT